MNKLILTESDVRAQVLTICRNIMLSGWRPDYVVGLTRGGLVPAVWISHFFQIPMHTLSVSLRDSETGPETNCWMSEDAFGYVDSHIMGPEFRKNILVVDDINDTGATLNWIMQDWQSGCLPGSELWSEIWNHNVRFAVLIDNQSSTCKTHMDYSALEINKAESDVWIDFPWESWWTR